MKLTPKEKAEELINSYRNSIMSFLSDRMKDENAKKCALIAVNEILENFGLLTAGKDHYCAHLTTKYYEEVKQEILTYGVNK